MRRVWLVLVLVLGLAGWPPAAEASPTADDDRAWTTAGDADGLHVLVGDGAGWRTVATLSEPGFEADRWIGQGCRTASGRRAVVVYAPRTFTNQAALFDRGGFTAVVDLDTGAVTKLPITSSLAYFNPGCGAGETAVLTQLGGEELARTRLTTVDATTAKLARPVEVPGEVTSAVPAGRDIAAADGYRLVRIAPDGTRTRLAHTAGVPYRVHADADGGVTFLERSGDRARATRVDRAGTRVLATGALRGLGLSAGTGGRVFITGEPDAVGALPGPVRALRVPARATVSGSGRLAVVGVEPAPTGETGPIKIDLAGAARPVVVEPDPAGRRTSPALRGTTPTTRAAANETVDAGYSCAVPRNDLGTQIYQPTPRQIEWAADQAVHGALTLTRPAGWKGNGLGAYSPQSLFPRIPLNGTNDGAVPPQLLLGVMSQESNLWQAARYVPEGAAGNPLIGNYYGMAVQDLAVEARWEINFAKADCGYGVGQITDGMRRYGYEKPGTIATRSQFAQRAIVTDYTANIAEAARILQGKWNELHPVGGSPITLGNDDPSRLENWFYAVWAYNSGFHQRGEAGANGAWGLGWLNNPINPRYPADRGPFLKSPSDAAHPGDWPYPEKVLGFAGNSIAKPSGPGFKPAWWNTDAAKDGVKPPLDAFCNELNDCVPGGHFDPDAPEVDGEPLGPCAHRNAAGQYDLKCWVHMPSMWKGNCDYTCGYGWDRFDPGKYPEQPDGTGSPPDCHIPVDLAGAWIIDDTPDSYATIRPGCGKDWTSAGGFRLDFGDPLSRIDLHQISAGLGGHFWFGHTRTDAESRAGKLKVTGTWTLNQRYDGWGQVLVHMPDIGAHTQQAAYTVDLGDGRRKTRTLLQRTEENRWVSLGVFPFAGTPSISLSNITRDGGTDEDIAWDAVAINPLVGKPDNFIVSMGDSFASGEGVGGTFGERFFRETDNNGGNEHRNACHRSKEAWARTARWPGRGNTTIGDLNDHLVSDVDFHFLACSGARTRNLLPGGTAFRELSQVDSGYLDENTTLVTLSIGGNDADFVKVMTECFKPGSASCQHDRLDGDADPMEVALPRRINDQVRPSVVTVLTEIRRAAPNARILLMGYPTLFEPNAGCLDPLITPEEANWLAAIGGVLDGALGNAAATVDRVTYLPVGHEFDGHRFCGAGELAFNGIVTDKTGGDPPNQPISAQSFHPNRRGADLLSDIYTAQLARMIP